MQRVAKLEKLMPEMFTDLQELLDKGRISRAMDLTKSFSEILGRHCRFAHHRLPHYPVNNLDAKTVFVHLNPGADLGNIESDSAFFDQRWDGKFYYDNSKARERSCQNIDEMTANFLFDSEWFARIRFGELKERDHFDFKQACFLRHWPDSGISLGDKYNDTIKEQDRKNEFKIQRQDSINVLDQKLQMELFPYGSNKMNTADITRIFRAKPELVRPYIERLLDLIVLHPRKYVLFGSALFARLFRLYDENVDKVIDYKENRVPFPGIIKNNLNFEFMRLTWKGKVIDAGIAHSFALQSLPHANRQMEEYGKRSAEHFLQKQHELG